MVILAAVIGATPAPVHTTGINWDSIAVLVIAIVGCFIGVATYIDHKAGARQDAIKDNIQGSVNHLSDVLLERLETKDNVNALRVEVAQLKTEVVDLRTKVRLCRYLRTHKPSGIS